MKKLMAVLTILAGVTAVGVVRSQATGQQNAPRTPPAVTVGLVDLDHIFKNYEKLTRQQELFQADVQQKQEQLSALANRMKQLDEERKQFNPASQEFKQRDDELTQLRADLAAQAQQAEKAFSLRDATMVRRVYLDIEDMIGRVAKRNRMSLVLRVQTLELTSTSSPRELAKELGKQVLYHEPAMDITKSVLHYLNVNYRNAISGASKAPSKTRSARKTQQAPRRSRK